MNAYRKIIGIIVVFTVLFSGNVYSYPKKQSVYSEDFEQLSIDTSLTSVGWIKDNPGTGLYVVKEDPVNSDNRCAYITNTHGEMYVRKSLPSVCEDTFIVEYDIYVDTNDDRVDFAVLGNTPTGGIDVELLVVRFTQSGNINLNHDTVSKFQGKKWYSIKIELDVINNICNMYVNDFLVAREAKLLDNKTASSITRIRFRPLTPGVSFYFDNMSMYSSFESIRKSIDMDCSNVVVENGMINVKQFGALPDDDVDDCEAIYRATYAAVKLGPNVGVEFEQGRYLFLGGQPGDYEQIISISNADGLSLVGHNTEFLICDSFTGGFKITESKNVNISGISIDYSKAPWTQGYVENIDKENCCFDYRTMDGYGDKLDDPRMESYKGFAMILDKNNIPLLKADARDHFGVLKWEKLEENFYRMYVSPTFSTVITEDELETGDCVTLNTRKNSGSAFAFYRCENSSINNCNVYAANNTVFIATYLTGKTVLNNVNALIKEGSDRWLVSNADGVHIQGSRGPVEVTNCTFEGISDDCINIYNKPAYISSAESDTVIVVRHEQQVPLAGETIRVYDIETGTIRGESKIIKAEAVANASQRLASKYTLATPIPGMKSGSSYQNSDEVFSIESQAPGTIIKDNTFSDSRRYGVYLKTVDTLIDNNIFKNLGGNAIVIENDMYSYWEGATARNMVVDNNTISNTPYRDEYRSSTIGSTILILASKLGGASYYPVHENITFTNNTIDSAGRYVLYASNAKSLAFQNNSINIPKQETTDKNTATIAILNSDGVEIGNNVITDGRSSLAAAIKVDDYSENVEINDNKIDIPQGAKQLSRGTEAEIFVPKTKKPIVLDGNTEEWENAFEFKAGANEVRQFNDGWNKEDLSIDGKLLWDENNLYIAVAAVDDAHKQTFSPVDAWQGDSLQFAVDPDRSKRPGMFGYNEATIALNDGGEVLSSLFTSLNDGAKRQADSILASITRDDVQHITTYELAVPWKLLLLSGTKANVGKEFGFSLLINDCDKTSRKGWIEYFSGIGSGKRPDNYGMALLVENADDSGGIMFDDISGIPEEESILKLVKKCIILGNGTTRFYPAEFASRVDMLSMLLKAAEITDSRYGGGLNDVNAKDWYSNIVQGAFDAGIVDLNMLSNGSFNPNAPINIGEACALVVRAFGLDYSENVGTVWTDAYINTCLQNELVSTAVDASDYCTRAFAAEMIFKATEVNKD